MSTEVLLAAALQALCPRVFPDVADLSTTRPYVTYQFIGGQSARYLDGAPADQRNSLVQINVWDTLRADVNTLARAIEDALCAATAFTARPIGEPMHSFDQDLGLRGTAQTFSVWAPR